MNNDGYVGMYKQDKLSEIMRVLIKIKILIETSNVSCMKDGKKSMKRNSVQKDVEIQHYCK
jgi:hypothetical protein